MRAHKDYNESVQSGLNSAVQLLSALVTCLGTVSLVLFSSTRGEYVIHNSSTWRSSSGSWTTLGSFRCGDGSTSRSRLPRCWPPASQAWLAAERRARAS